jgi:hypothetical protein
MQAMQVEQVAAEMNFKSPAAAHRAIRQSLVRAYHDDGRTVRMIQILLRRKHGIAASIGTIHGDLKGHE